jgi:type II secretory pathway predicted ATPase ExeA
MDSLMLATPNLLKPMTGGVRSDGRLPGPPCAPARAAMSADELSDSEDCEESAVYEAFFGLRTRPFPAVPGPDDLTPLEPFEQALNQLSRCLLEGSGIAVLTAPAGAGKTVLCRALCRRVQPTLVPVFLGTAGFATRRAMLQAILFELGQDYAGISEQELRLRLLQHVRGLRARAEGVLLVADEAQQLNARLLEELRALTNHSDDGRPLVRLMLSGQLELEELLADRELAAFNQRIACHVVLESLTREESARYLALRLERAGANIADVLTREAVALICEASDGNPRCLHQLSDHSLLLAYVAEEKPVTVQTVRTALGDLQELPLQWNMPTRMASAETQEPEVGEEPELHEPDCDVFAASRGALPSSRTTVEAIPADVPDVDEPNDIAVLEIGAEATLPARCAENARTRVETGFLPSQTVSRSERDVVPFSDASPVVGERPDIVEVEVDDPYARLDQVREPDRSAAAIPLPVVEPPRPAPTVMFPDFLERQPSDPFSRHEVLEGDIEDRLLDQLQELRDELREVGSRAPRRGDDYLPWSDDSAVWGGAGAGAGAGAVDEVFDVVEPESQDEVVPPADVTLRFDVAGDAREIISKPSCGPATNRPQEEAAPAVRYAQLFTRLKRRRREAALALRDRR